MDKVFDLLTKLSRKVDQYDVTTSRSFASEGRDLIFNQDDELKYTSITLEEKDHQTTQLPPIKKR